MLSRGPEVRSFFIKDRKRFVKDVNLIGVTNIKKLLRKETTKRVFLFDREASRVTDMVFSRLGYALQLGIRSLFNGMVTL